MAVVPCPALYQKEPKRGDGGFGRACQSATGSIQYASDTEESEQEEIDFDLTVEGDSTTDCTQEVNQAAAAG